MNIKPAALADSFFLFVGQCGGAGVKSPCREAYTACYDVKGMLKTGYSGQTSPAVYPT